MLSIVTDQVMWSVGLSSQSVTLVSPGQMAEPIEMQFWLGTRVGPTNHVLDGGPDPPMRRGNFERGKGRSIVKHLCKTAEPIKMLFGLLAQMGPRNHVLDGRRGNFGGKGRPL